MIRVLVAIAVLLLTGLAAPAHADRPAARSCHRLSWAQIEASSEPTPAIPCTAQHNTQTIAVVDVPGLPAMSEDEFATAGHQACFPRYRRILGKPWRRAKLTGYSFAFFGPTPEQLAAGESWVRCDLMLQVGTTALQPLPRHALKRPVVPAQLPDRLRSCLRVVLRSLTGYAYTVCSRRHDLRAVTSFPMRSGRYPRDKAFTRAARQRCPQDWELATWPSALAWQAGDHVVVCYVKG